MAREVEYSRGSGAVYARVLREVQGAKADIASADGALVGGLNRQLGGARLLAAQWVGREGGGAVAAAAAAAQQ